MIDVYLRSNKNTDIEQIGLLSTIGFVTMSYKLNGKNAVPTLVNNVTQDNGEIWLLARFDGDTDTDIETTLTVQTKEVERPSVAGKSSTNGRVVFSFTDDKVESDWQDATSLSPVA